MWKRLRGKETTQISAPTLIDTTYDGRPHTRPRPSDFSPISPSNTIRPIGSSHGSTTILNPQPRKLYTSIAPLVDSYAQRAAEEPTSVYSQDPQDLAYQLGSPHSGYANPEISPPASPDFPTNLEYQRRSVSPVEPTSPDQVLSSRSPQSHIPVMKRAPGSADASAGRERTASGSATKWDTYSGEPTTSAKGRPGSFRPGDSIEIPRDASSNIDRSAYSQGSVDRQSRVQALTQRAAQAQKQDHRTEPQPRQPWRGASGRQPIVAPMPDRTAPREHPVMPPPRSNRRPAPSNEGPTVVRPARSDSYGAMSPAPAAHLNPASQARAPPGPPQEAGSGRRQPHQRKQSDHTKRVPRKSVDTTASAIDPNDPISRFSWTTYATNTTYQSSPPPSPPPPIPAAFANGGSVLNRGRPVPVNKEDEEVYEPTSPPLKIPPVRRIRENNKENEPTSSARNVPQFAQINTKIVAVADPAGNTPRSATGSTTPTGRSGTPSTRGGGKALPAPPQDPSRDPNDHIAVMQARLDDLSHQRINIAKAEQSIRAKQPQNPLITDLKAMRELERKLDALREELEEVKREEHEIGLKLHRAWRKREKEEGGWDGGLWVRRVTG